MKRSVDDSSSSSSKHSRVDEPAPSLAQYEQSLDDRQRAALRSVLVDREHTIVTGPGGVGKSFVLRRIIDAARELFGRRVEVVTPTGVAAVTLGCGATTLHRYLGISQFDKPWTFYVHELKTRPWLVDSRARILRTDVLVVDEISMVPATLFETLDEVLRAVRERTSEAFGGVQLVICGDFCQIAPVQGDYAYTSDVWRSTPMRRFDLTTPHRQASGSTHFNEFLLRARFGAPLADEDMALLRSRVTYPPPSPATSTRLCFRNVDVDAVNAAQLRTLDAATAHTYATTIEYRSSRKHRQASAADKQRKLCVEQMFKAMRAPRTLEVRTGARVMMLVNEDVEAGLANGTLGTVVGFDDAAEPALPLVEFEGVAGGPRRVRPHRFEFKDDTRFTGALVQLPLALAWSITLHKSQSTTLSSAVIDLRRGELPARGRGRGLAYTGVSRVTSEKGLFLLATPDRDIFEADPRSVEESRRAQ